LLVENNVVAKFNCEKAINRRYHFADPEESELFLPALSHPNIGVLLDLGHLVVREEYQAQGTTTKEEYQYPRGILVETDIEICLQRFERQNEDSLIQKRFTLDTSTVTVEETMHQFLCKMEPLLSTADRLRMLTHCVLREGDQTSSTGFSS